MLFNEHSDDESHIELYRKYMSFHKIMLEEYSPLEIASILVVQGMSFYKTVMDDEDYQKVVKSIYDRRDSVHTFE